MITVKPIADRGYNVYMDIPERHVVAAIAVAFSISQPDAMVAIINRGMDSIAKQLKAEAAKATEKRLADGADYGGD